MKYDILGEIEGQDDHPFEGVATVQYDSRGIRVRMDADGQPFENTLKLAADVVRRLQELDSLAKRIAADKLLEVYNSGWNEYDEAQEDGSLKSVSNPKLSAAQFIAKLSLTDVDVTGDQMITFYYNDEGMFWGHAVVITSLSGIEFRDAFAEICG